MQRIVPFLLLSAAAAWGQSPLSGSKPNIVLILADDLSFRDLGIWGQDKFRTPHLDALAAAGVRFTQAYAGAPECAPSRGTLMTGLHVGHAPIRSNRSARGQDHLYPEDITLAETLKRAGYATGFFGKWGIGLPGTPGTPDKQGFDVAFGFYDQRRAHTFFPRYLYANAERIDYPGNDGFDMDHMYLDNRTKPEVRDTRKHYTADGALIPPGVADPAQAVYSQAVIEERALQFVRQRRSNPFFLYFATQLPHGPLIVDSLGDFNRRDDFPTVAHREWAAMVARLDAFAGRLVGLLKRLGLYDDTLIVFASDNGYSMCGYTARGNAAANWPDDPFFRNKGPFRGGKFSVLEGGIRVPFFMHQPKKIAAAVSGVPVWLIDLMPTLADLAGVKPAHAVDGESLTPLLQGNATDFPADRPLYWAADREQAVRMGPWKAYRKSPERKTELYLIEEDIHGDRDLADAYPQIVKRIEAVMASAHVDHPWYWNPSETAADFKRKQARAAALGQLQEGRTGNSGP